MLPAFTACPGLFYATPAQDGILTRIRIPGGIINNQQFCAIADIADNCGGGYVDVTNRANIQIREIKSEISNNVYSHLQSLGIGANNPHVDHIRNIMTSPTAGIDAKEVIDTRPFVQAWDEYICNYPQLGALSAKFSVSFDGGGQVSVQGIVNDISLNAVLINNAVYFRLCLSFGEKGKLPEDTGILLTPDECLPVLAALAAVYLQYTDTTMRRKVRLREVINNLGVDKYLDLALGEKFTSRKSLHSISTSPNHNYSHVGIHRQKQPQLFYIGVVLPLGRLETWQIRGLVNIVEKLGNGNIRLTPWQNLLVTDIPAAKLVEVETEIVTLGLSYSPTNIQSALVACSGKRGCASAMTETKDHALALANYIQSHIALEQPINIHFSGCSKSCAQQNQGDITLLGVAVETENQTLPGYQVYLGDGSLQKFGRQIYDYVSFAELPQLIEKILRVYKNQRLNLDETFSNFITRHDIPELKQLLN
ncbi:precorrin-3B synthase [Richelia sinica]|uniref:precorrin-3B synthase n=1 Tax=Richelia sinica TaxID=1357545 RepID=UPI00168765C3|nr:precorrin-3B synthase [Richelia sinica]MBD2663263.1 precorrin-3B synthase [Richelia sinica FACHB-800]